MANFTVSFKDIDGLSTKLKKADFSLFEKIVIDNTRQLFNRGKASDDPSKGGTPFDMGELRLSLQPSREGYESEVGYTRDYAPHVEYGHRTKNGGYVPGQSFLKTNVELQRPIYKRDLQSAMNKLTKKGG